MSVVSEHSARPQKRKRYTRSRTGCRACRNARVKCPEGGLTSAGYKTKCKRCWETDIDCWYPGPVDSQAVRHDHSWCKATEEGEWRPMDPVGEERNASSPSNIDGIGRETLHQSPGVEGSQSPWRSTGSPDGTVSNSVSIDSLLESIFAPGRSSPSTAHSAWLCPVAENDRSLPSGSTSETRGQCMIEPAIDEFQPVDTSAIGGPVVSAEGSLFDFSLLESFGYASPTGELNQVMAATHGVSPDTNTQQGNHPTASMEFLRALLEPSPSASLSTFSLASFSAREGDRSVVSYFESQGYNDIVATSRARHNWIFAQLFPRLYSLLSFEPTGNGIGAAIRQWLHHCLLQLSFVHRANTEIEPARSLFWRTEAIRHRQLGSYQVLRAKVRFPSEQWKTKEYLMGFFVRCMADMLNANTLVIDHSNTFELGEDTSSPFNASLRDMLGLYSTMQFACTPVESLCYPHLPTFQLPVTGPEWVEHFVGFSRRLIILLGKVNTMVAQRFTFIRAGTERSAPGTLLRAQAEKLVLELGESWGWDETVRDLGKSARIQRGNEVMRSALQVLLLAEILVVDLLDPRLQTARERALELVADSELTAMGGYQCALNIIAVYTPMGPWRARVLESLATVVSMSFGVSYRNTEEILALCWEVLDSNGKYENGIAPWREAMTALGKSLFI